MALKTKEVYQTNHEGVFVGVTIADESPLEAGQDPVVWLIPGGAVEVAPPEIPEGKLARLVGGAWVLEDIPAPEPALVGEE